MFFIFDLFKSILFLLTEFHYIFPCLIKYYHIVFINIVPPGGSGWTIGVDSLENSSTVLGVATPGKIGLNYSLGLLDFIFRARFTSFRAHALFLSSPVFLSYLILVVPMRKCLGKYSCMSSP